MKPVDSIFIAKADEEDENIVLKSEQSVFGISTILVSIEESTDT
jgi:hypothetical protein